MLGPLLANALASGRIACPHCHSAFISLAVRYASQSHYQILGIDRKASQQEIKTAFIELSKQLHPDVNKKDPKTHEKFVKLNEAYMVLSKPLTRRSYDLTLAGQVELDRQARRASTSHGFGSSPYPGSNQNGEYEDTFYDDPLFYRNNMAREREFAGKRRFSTVFIVTCCFGLMAAGSLLHFMAFKVSQNIIRNSMETKDRKAAEYLHEARSNARKANMEKLIDLEERLKSAPRRASLRARPVPVSSDEK